jgi:hypothetical protein
VRNHCNEAEDVTAAHTPDIIEGAFRVVSDRPMARGWSSPNTRRRVARIVLWNCAVALALVVVPQLVG